MSLCPYNAATQSASAMAIPEDPADPNKFIFACTATGVAAKCARNWGYKPWARRRPTSSMRPPTAALGAWELQTFDLKPYYDVCKNAAQAAYCQDGHSYTKNGTQVDLFDTRQIIWPNAIENPWSASNDDSLWMMAQEYFISTGRRSRCCRRIKDSALQRTRYRELSPVSECDNIAFIDRLEHDHIEDGRWASPLTNTPAPPGLLADLLHARRVHRGRRAAVGLQPVHDAGLQDDAGCCGAGPTPGLDRGLRRRRRRRSARRAACQWPPGRSGRSDIAHRATSRSTRSTCSGRGARSLRADGVSGSGSSATISGWACDPEWPGATVAVRDLRRRAARGGRHACSARCAPTRRWRRRSRARSAPPATARAAPTRATGSRSRCPRTSPATSSSTRSTRHGRRSGRAADADPQRHRPCPALRAQRARRGRGAVRELQRLRRAGLQRRHARRLLQRRLDRRMRRGRRQLRAPATAPRRVNSRSFAAVTTGWIEAPADGHLHVRSVAAAEPPVHQRHQGARLVRDLAGDDERNDHPAGRAEVPPALGSLSGRAAVGPPGPGLTWQPPGDRRSGRDPDGQPLRDRARRRHRPDRDATTRPPASAGASSRAPTPNIDINNDIAPPGATPLDLPAGYGPSYSAIWEGEIVPSFTEDYTFYVVGSGTATLHDQRQPVVAFRAGAGVERAGRLRARPLRSSATSWTRAATAACRTICAKDPLLLRRRLPLVLLVRAGVGRAAASPRSRPYCPPVEVRAARRRRRRLAAEEVGRACRCRRACTTRSGSSTATRAPTRRFASCGRAPRQAKQAVPQFALYPRRRRRPAPASGLNVTYFGDDEGTAIGEARPRRRPSRPAWCATSR